MEINAIGILGSDAVGIATAELFVKHGFQVRLYDNFKDSLAVALARISWSLRKDGKEELLGNIEGVQDLSKFGGADIIMEAVDKPDEERKLLFTKLRKHLDSSCIVAAGCAVRPLKDALGFGELPKERTLGLNLARPVDSCQLAELVRTEHTRDEYVEAAAALMRKIGKTPVMVRDNPGQISARLIRPFILSALRLMEAGRGCPHEIDEAFREIAGAKAGPLELADFYGLDSGFIAGEFLYEALGRPERLLPSPTEGRLVQYGQLGRKSTIGFYIYDDGRIVGENPVLSNLVKYLGLKKTFKEDIFGELMRPVVEEAKLLANEAMVSEYDIETVAKLGFGWSKGPFAYSRDMGRLLEKKAVSEFDQLDTF